MASKKTQKPKRMSRAEIDRGLKALEIEEGNLVVELLDWEETYVQHMGVFETLREADGDSKCYRKFGDFLCETTVKQYLLKFELHMQYLEQVIANVRKQLSRKEQDIAEYRAKYKC